mmetsp:Transcript_7758/g.15088  ORF Transcript_7758/g.15088 Transcript_7758/m.15088 type:complete len:237 (+) Transcript_7758:1601-2311(+)
MRESLFHLLCVVLIDVLQSDRPPPVVSSVELKEARHQLGRTEVRKQLAHPRDQECTRDTRQIPPLVSVDTPPDGPYFDKVESLSEAIVVGNQLDDLLCDSGTVHTTSHPISETADDIIVPHALCGVDPVYGQGGEHQINVHPGKGKFDDRGVCTGNRNDVFDRLSLRELLLKCLEERVSIRVLGGKQKGVNICVLQNDAETVRPKSENSSASRPRDIVREALAHCCFIDPVFHHLG